MQVSTWVDQEQKITDDARRYAEKDDTTQRYVVQVLQVYNLVFSNAISNVM